MFGKIREKLTFYISTFILLNASAFGGYVLAQDAVEEIVVTARKKQKAFKTYLCLFPHLERALLKNLE